MLQKIVIRPLDAGWMVELERLDAPMVFKSGAQAERAARALAERLIDVGERAELIIHLRDGALAGRFVATPAVSPGGAAEMDSPTPAKMRLGSKLYRRYEVEAAAASGAN